MTGKIKAYAPPPADSKPLSPTELLAALREALHPWERGSPFWIFGYGSLMWNPGLDYDVRRVSTIYGYHRNFCLWSRINRGTPERPGLVLTLERGGSCRGLAFRLRREVAEEQLLDLWKREMSLGSYLPRWLECHSGTDSFRALGFVVNRLCTGYAGKLPIDTVVQAISTGRGKYGSSAEYLFRTEATLAEHGIRDAHVQQLVDRVRQHLRTD